MKVSSMMFPSSFVVVAASMMMMMMTTVSSALEVGDEICVEGFVMDFFCINRGTLFDNPSVRTLEMPERHSVHCLVDVPPCVASPFEILIPLSTPTADGLRFSRGFRLDDPSKETILALARAVGRPEARPACDTCDQGGILDRGFHAGMVATVVSTGSSSEPAVISVSRAEHSMPDNLFCGLGGFGTTGMEASTPNATITAASDTKDFSTAARAHGALMLIGWGWLLPSGVMVAKFFRHRPNGLWFKIHRACQILGLVCTIVGLIIAVTNFDVFSSGPGATSYAHGVMGATTMTLGLFQPLNALIRPHPNEQGQEQSNHLRTLWEYVHKGTGWSAILLAVATIGLGTTLLPLQQDQRAYQMAYGIGVGICLLSLIAFGIYDGATFQPVETSAADSHKKAQYDPTEQVDPAEAEA